MSAVVKNMDRAMSEMNLEKVLPPPSPSLGFTNPELKQISMIMDKFESQFEDLDVQTGYLEGTLSSDAAISAPTDQIDLLMAQTADEAGLEIQHELGKEEMGKVPDLRETVGEVEEDKLAQRLRALRPAV